MFFGLDALSLTPNGLTPFFHHYQTPYYTTYITSDHQALVTTSSRPRICPPYLAAIFDNCRMAHSLLTN
jgi:hypothetical protein